MQLRVVESKYILHFTRHSGVGVDESKAELSNPQAAGHMWPKLGMSVAQHFCGFLPLFLLNFIAYSFVVSFVDDSILSQCYNVTKNPSFLRRCHHFTFFKMSESQS